QRLAQLLGASLHLVEQSHVLDHDHRLVGEGGRQLDLLVGEWAHRTPGKHDDADGISLSQERNAEHRAVAGPFLGFPKSILRIRKKIGNMNRFRLQKTAAHDAPSSRLQGNALEVLTEFERETLAWGPIVLVPFLTCNGGHLRPRKAAPPTRSAYRALPGDRRSSG